jgi:mycothiol synthase
MLRVPPLPLNSTPAERSTANIRPMLPRIKKLSASDHEAVIRFLTLVQLDHARAVLSEHKSMRVGTNSVTEWIVEADGEWVAYFQAAEHGPAVFDVEIVVLAGREGVIPEAVHEVCAELGGSIQVWAWTPELMLALEEAGAEVERALLEMRVPLPLVQTYPVPEDFVLREFRVSEHSEDLRTLINRAFAGHREAGGMTREGLALRFDLPWFSEQDVLAAWSGGRLAGVCWTKHPRPGIGEIYIIGVDPDFTGSGLGRALVSEGLRHQYDRYHVTSGSLWTEEANTRAVGMYRSMGFTIAFENYAYGIPTAGSSSEAYRRQYDQS